MPPGLPGLDVKVEGLGGEALVKLEDPTVVKLEEPNLRPLHLNDSPLNRSDSDTTVNDDEGFASASG